MNQCHSPDKMGEIGTTSSQWYFLAAFGIYQVLISATLVEFTYFKSYNKNNLTFISFLARC